MDEERVATWIEGYIRAWNSNEPEDIRQLFTEDAVYYTGPFDEPWKGREAILQGWLEARDEPGTFEFRYQVLAASENTGVIRGWTKYFQPERDYSNIWVIEFSENGRCREFTEWWVGRDRNN